MPFGMLYMKLISKLEKKSCVLLEKLSKKFSLGRSETAEILHEVALLVATSNLIIRFGFF
jgi:hypothetical protein